MARPHTATRTPEATRRKILDAAFAEFYANSFQGGSLNDIVAAAGTTKGALFHHFASKHDLGYAVLDDLIGPLLLERWLSGLTTSHDPLTELKASFRQHVSSDITTGHWLNGCPLNNLAQEMSPLDDGFHSRINRLYDIWRERVSAALVRGIQAGTVRSTVDADKAAALIVSGQMGIWGSGKSSRRENVMRQAAEGLCDYLESLRP
jgi:TetR/AcrR family transcriptional repressor of nem operon